MRESTCRKYERIIGHPELGYFCAGVILKSTFCNVTNWFCTGDQFFGYCASWLTGAWCECGRFYYKECVLDDEMTCVEPLTEPWSELPCDGLSYVCSDEE
jgi:hypothetical protein